MGVQSHKRRIIMVQRGLRESRREKKLSETQNAEKKNYKSCERSLLRKEEDCVKVFKN